MNLINYTPLFRFGSLVFIVAAPMLLLIGCVQPQITLTIAPTASAVSTLPPMGETLTASPSATLSPTLTASGSPSPTLTATITPSPIPSASPTITPTPAPTWTPWQIDMNFSPTEQIVLSLKNPVQYCMLTYFDLTPKPGYLGVWRRDNGGYMACMNLAQ